MKFNKIYANGCSFSCAGGLNWDRTKELYKQKLNIDISNHIEYAYPNVLAKKFGVSIVNDAVSGGSINRLVRTTYEYIFKNQNDLENTLFILEIPPCWRDEFYSHELGRTINITGGNIDSIKDQTDVANGYDKDDIKQIHKNITNYFYHFVDISYDTFKFNTALLGLLSYIKLNKINYLLLDSFTFYKFNKENNLPNDYNYVFFETKFMSDWIYSNGLLITNETNGEIHDAHAGVYGNLSIAEHLYYTLTKEKKII
jgi:hypothetical protein